MRFSVAFLSVLAVAFGPSVTEAQTNTCNSATDKDILELACDPDNADFFGELCDALEDTGIDGSIPRDNGVYTVFAPVNSAFDSAGRRIGVTRSQKQATLQYHIVQSEIKSPACGDEFDTLLFWLGERQTVEIGCTSGVVDSVVGDVTLPVPATPDPLIRSIGGLTTTTGSDPPLIEACNGVIYPINNILGFGPIQYDWAFQPCAFNDPDCVRPLTIKAGKGVIVPTTQNVGGLSFVSYNTKKAKNFGFQQSFYANNAYNYFGPYYNGFYGPYGGYGGYGYKHAKKGGYGYGYGYGQGYGQGYGYGGYGYGYGYPYGNRGRYYGYRRQLESGEEDRVLSPYEPIEYVEDNEDTASSAGDYYYNYRKNRNLRRGARDE